MEIERACVPDTEVRQLWQFCVSSDPFAQGPLFILIGQCIVWMVIFCCFRCLSLSLQARHREERQQEGLRDHEEQSNTEQDLIKQMLLLGTSSTTSVQKSTSTASIPVSICVDNTCGVELFGGLSLRDALVRESDEEVTFLQTSADLVAQTRVTRLSWPRTKLGGPPNPTESICSHDKRERFRMQLGRWHLIFRPSTENNGAKSMDLSTSDVPVILHSSYSGGILIVEGLHLAQATIQAATKEKCIILKTKYEKGPGELQVFTSESGLPSKTLAEVFVLASKNIVANGDELRVHSQAVRIRNDSLNTVIRSVIPFTILVFFATKQLAVSLKRIMETTISASVLAWQLPILLLVSTLILPRRTETIITVTLKKLAMRAYHTLYFAAQCFIPGRDPEVLSISESLDSRLHGNHVVQSVPTPKIEDFGYQGGEQAKREPEPVPCGEESDVVNPEWEWPVYDTIRNKYTEDKLVRRMKDTDKKAKEQMVPFSVVHRNLKAFPWASQVVVRIQSAPLLEIIKVLMPDKVDQSATLKQEVELDRPELFRIFENLRKEQISAAEQISTAEQPNKVSGTSSSGNKTKLFHLNHLLRFLDEDLKQSRLFYSSMIASEHKVSWDMLWAFYPPGERVVYRDVRTEENLCGDVLNTRYGQNSKDEMFFNVEVSKWDYNCETWTSYSTKLKVPTFGGELEIFKLNILPVRFTSEPAKVIDEFKKQGKKFCKLSMLERNCFMNYKGSMMVYDQRYYHQSKENADGRVMVDLRNFAKMNPDGSQLGSAQPPCVVIRENTVTKLDITREETRMFAPAIVYGFSFHLKKWGRFSVSGFSKIFFKPDAFDDLVMNADTKDVVENLVRKQLDDGKVGESDDRERMDSISSKGEGSIILCFGPPGTGKTLTAESLAEKLRCPLWSLSVSELGITPGTLETTLVKVMDVAASWGAILLLDEADVFLERRTSSDLTRKAMTGIFLRQLEYYRGVVFLTTNRDSAFDDAMCSRVSIFLHYERHSEDQRRLIWSKMFERVGLELADEELAEFALPKFNGREIRNIVKNAHTLARSKGDEGQLEINHVKRALKVYEASTKIWVSDRENLVIPAPERVEQDGWKKVRRTLSAGSLSS